MISDRAECGCQLVIMYIDILMCYQEFQLFHVNMLKLCVHDVKSGWVAYMYTCKYYFKYMLINICLFKRLPHVHGSSYNFQEHQLAMKPRWRLCLFNFVNTPRGRSLGTLLMGRRTFPILNRPFVYNSRHFLFSVYLDSTILQGLGQPIHSKRFTWQNELQKW